MRSNVLTISDIRHCFRVAKLARVITQILNLKSSESNKIYIAASLHDIGKSFIDDAILSKPSSLTKEEKKIMKMHVFYGQEEVKRLGYEAEIADIILQHHENFNGTGYLGFQGEEILLGARIIRICDIFDALTTDRVYKKSLSIQESLKIMDAENEQGLYDQKLYSIFKKYIEGDNCCLNM